MKTTTVYTSIAVAATITAMTPIAGRLNRIKRLELFGYKAWPTDGSAPTNNAGAVSYGWRDAAGVSRIESLAAGAKVTITAPEGTFLPETLIAYGTATDFLWIRAICA